MVTGTEPPGLKLPLAGLKVTPVRLLLADQVALRGELVVSPRLTIHL